ncbi:glycosyltransferase [Actinomyces sp. HMSC065F11]|uniref:glycosyltransferase n=1 Tax=Actinomyces sp. HMSC065F11 TaxID=1739395 RepID=UPI0008A65D1B|nr:glycosyltransferase [Actinomyces sp. HMSC065F11]OFR31183.1 hypothetical protein HMPREF2891_03830 [Actinomyces sp. HMSC065F11]
MLLTGMIVSRIFSPEASAASLRLDAVREALLRGGVDISVLTTNPPPGIEVKSDRKVVRVPVLRDSEGYIKGYASYASFDLQAFVRVLTSPRVDFLLVEPPPTTGAVMRVASTIRRIPYFWYAADVWSDATDGMDVPNVVKKVVRGLEKFAIRGADGCIAVSDGVAQRVIDMGARSVEVVPNGADTKIFNPYVEPLYADELEAMGVREPFFIYAGTASQWQGADLFAKAFERLWDTYEGDAQLLYLTRGDSIPALKQIAERLERVARDRGKDYSPLLVHSTVSASLAARWQRQALASCVSIQPGIGYDFAYPTKVLTSLSCGTPVIYAGAGPANDDILDYNLGRSVPYDEKSVAKAMEELLSQYSNADEDLWDKEALHQWVKDNRSMESTGLQVAQYIFDRLKKKDSRLIG